MKKHKMPDMKEGGVNVTPLIDVVMCLIIFFMLVARIGVSRGTDNKIEIPSSILGMKIEDMGNTLTLNVRQGAMDEPMVTALVENQVREIKLREDRGSGVSYPLRSVLQSFRKIKGDLFKVIIRAPRDLPYRFIEPVLITCAEADVKNVNFNTKKGSEEPAETPVAMGGLQ